MFRVVLLAGVAFTAMAQTKIDLRTQAKQVDFTAATSTKPMKTGTALPGTCAVGEMFFKTDAPAGANLYGCTVANTWSVQGGISSQSCWYDSTDQTLKCRDGAGNVYAAVRTASGGTANQWVDYISTAGVPHTSQPTAAAVGAVADPGANGIPYRSGAGAATPANADNLSAAFACQDTGAVNAYACNLTPAISVYTAGTTYWFKAAMANTGSATINFNGLGAKSIVKQSNQQLAAGDIKPGQWVMATYDGIAMQMQSQTANPGSGAVASVFGRSGSVTAQSGDYTTTQVTESGNLYFTNTRAQAAFSYPGVVKLSSGALDCPACITSATPADTDLYGTFPHLSVAGLQGRPVAGTQPADLQYLGWNNSAGRWEPKTVPAPPVTSVLGRSGTVTAQSGDYSFGQIAGTIAATQLPATAMRTDRGNTVTAGTQDMSGADHTLPMKSGTTASRPGTCQPGETYFATDAPAGNNIYGCTAANTWSSQGTNLTVASNGTVVGWRPKVNFMTGPGLTSLLTDNGSEIDILWALDTATVQTQPGEQTGTALLCASASNSSRDYRCSLTPTIDAYTTGMVLHWKPDVNGVGGPTTLNVDTLGAVPVKLRDGASDPTSTDLMAGQLYDIWYDGARFRLMMPTASTASGSVLSVFGRQGAVIPQTGDYTAAQVTNAVDSTESYTNPNWLTSLPWVKITGAPSFEPSISSGTASQYWRGDKTWQTLDTSAVAENGNLYFTNARALAAVTWSTLTGKPSTFTAAPHASTHSSGQSDAILPASIGAIASSAINQPNGVVGLDASGNAVIGTTVPGGAPSGSVAIAGKYYGDGSALTGVATGGGARSLNAAGTTAKCQNGLAAASFSGPALPVASCEADGISAYVPIAAASTANLYDRYELPADWAGSLKLVLVGYSTGANAATIAVSLNCNGSGVTTGLTWGTAQSITFTPASGSGRTALTTTLTTDAAHAVKACAAGDTLSIWLAVTAGSTDLRLLNARWSE